MLRNPCYYFLLILARLLLTTRTVNAGSFNYSLCAEIAIQTYSDAPNNSFLYDQQGRPTGNLAKAWGISYYSCKTLCGTENNSGYYDWGFLSQGISSWLIPWLALTAQLPFETKDKPTNFIALLLALGSPALCTYSLALTILGTRRINQKFRQIKEDSQTLHRPLQMKAMKAARCILIEMQHVPIQIYNGRRREISQLIVHPDNWAWWCALRQKLLITKRKWTYSLYAQVGWVCISQLLAIIDFFTSASSNSSIGIGLAINSLWLWMIPIVLGWVYVGNQNYAESVKAALTDTDVPILGSERNLKRECIGIKDRTIYDDSSTRLRDSLHRHELPRNGHSQQQGEPSPRDSSLNTAAPDAGLDTEQEHTSAASYQLAPVLQQWPDSLSDQPETLYPSQSGDTELRVLMTDRQISTTSTLRATEQQLQLLLEDDAIFDSLPQTFLGFSIAGDDLEPGPIFTYARVWTHMNASKQVAEAFRTLTRRQKQRETVNGEEWEEDPDRWNENLQGTPEQMSQYISPSHEDVQDFPVHAPASVDLVHNCVTAAYVAILLQWGTTGLYFPMPLYLYSSQPGAPKHCLGTPVPPLKVQR